MAQNEQPVIKLTHAQIEEAIQGYRQFMTALGLDMKDDHNFKTPERVVRAMVYDMWVGLYSDPPQITSFENDDEYTGIVFQGNIAVKSVCAHHHLPFFGRAHVAYIPQKHSKVIGLSKLNRLVEHYCRRPQVQERLTNQIADAIQEATPGSMGVAVCIEAKHMCAHLRGVEHDSTMITSTLRGPFFNDEKTRNEFYQFINRLPPLE